MLRNRTRTARPSVSTSGELRQARLTVEASNKQAILDMTREMLKVGESESLVAELRQACEQMGEAFR